MGVKPYAPQGEALGFAFPPDGALLCPRVGFMGRCAPGSPTFFHVGLNSLIRLMHRICSEIRFISEEVVSYLAADSVCPWREASPERFYVCLDPELIDIKKY